MYQKLFITCTLFSFFVLANSSIAAPSPKTPNKKFRPWAGTFVVTNAPIQYKALVGSQLEIFPDTNFFALLSPSRINIARVDLNHQPKTRTTLKGAYRSTGIFKTFFGDTGAIRVHQIAGSPFKDVRIVISSTVLNQPVEFFAQKLARHELRSTFANKMKIRGAKKIGKRINVTVTAINRGFEISQPGEVSITFVIDAVIKKLKIKGKKNLFSIPVQKACSTEIRNDITIVVCKLGYTGPSGKKLKAKSFAQFVASFTIPESLSTPELLLASRVWTSDATKKISKSKTKALRPKISGFSKKLLGIWSSGTIRRIHFVKEDGVTNGYAVEGGANCGFPVGTLMYKDIKKNSLVGKIAGQERVCTVGFAKYETVSFEQNAQGFLSREVFTTANRTRQWTR